MVESSPDPHQPTRGKRRSSRHPPASMSFAHAPGARSLTPATPSPAHQISTPGTSGSARPKTSSLHSRCPLDKAVPHQFREETSLDVRHFARTRRSISPPGDAPYSSRSHAAASGATAPAGESTVTDAGTPPLPALHRKRSISPTRDPPETSRSHLSFSRPYRRRPTRPIAADPAQLCRSRLGLVTASRGAVGVRRVRCRRSGDAGICGMMCAWVGCRGR